MHVLNTRDNDRRGYKGGWQQLRVAAMAQICICAAILGGRVSDHRVFAQEAPTTIWQSLGFGADQYSDNPAIKAAAKAKAAKHEICKKKKALEYLAGMGCSPEHPEVGPALIAAMGDPDEPVRYAAVKAVLSTAGECQSAEQKRQARKALGCIESCHDWKKKIEKSLCECVDRLFGKAPPKERKCKEKIEECCSHLKSALTGKKECPDPCKEDCPCGNGHGPCCSADMKKKLEELAYGRDEQGCFLETSERVRTVAELALQACASCNGEYMGMVVYDSVVRELPPAVERELAPDPDEARCVSDRPVIAVPESQAPKEKTPTPADEPLYLPAEPLPAPAAKSAAKKRLRPLRSVLVRPLPRSFQQERWLEDSLPWPANTLASTDRQTISKSSIRQESTSGYPSSRFSKKTRRDEGYRGVEKDQSTLNQKSLGRAEDSSKSRRPPRWSSNAGPSAALPAYLPDRSASVARSEPDANLYNRKPEVVEPASGLPENGGEAVVVPGPRIRDARQSPPLLLSESPSPYQSQSADDVTPTAQQQRHRPFSMLRFVAILLTAATCIQAARVLLFGAGGVRLGLREGRGSFS